MFDEVGERLGCLDGLVNNAARFTLKDLLEITGSIGTSSIPST